MRGKVATTQWSQVLAARDGTESQARAALERLQREAAESGNPGQFEKLKPFLTSAEPQALYSETAAELGMSGPGVKTAVHRLRQRYGQCLRAEIAETVAEPAEVDDEVRHLLAVVRPPPDSRL